MSRQLGCRVINSGYHIEFSIIPPANGLMRWTLVPSDQAKHLALETEIHGLVNKGAVFVVHPSQTHNLIRSDFFLAPKKSDLWRLILNFKKAVEQGYILTRRFRMETLSSIIPALSQGIWATSIDLKEAYLHNPIHKEHERYLAFGYQGLDQFQGATVWPCNGPKSIHWGFKSGSS